MRVLDDSILWERERWVGRRRVVCTPCDEHAIEFA
jgi:hypothetical protein